MWQIYDRARQPTNKHENVEKYDRAREPTNKHVTLCMLDT